MARAASSSENSPTIRLIPQSRTEYGIGVPAGGVAGRGIGVGVPVEVGVDVGVMVDVGVHVDVWVAVAVAVAAATVGVEVDSISSTIGLARLQPTISAVNTKNKTAIAKSSLFLFILTSFLKVVGVESKRQLSFVTPDTPFEGGGLISSLP